MPEARANTPAPSIPHIAVTSALKSLKAPELPEPVAVLPPVEEVLVADEPEAEAEEPDEPEVSTEELTPKALM